MREAAERQEFEEAARYRNRLYCGPPPGRAAGRGQARDRNRRRDRHRGRGTTARPCRSSRSAAGGSSTGTASTSRTSPARTSHALLEAFCLEYYGSAPSIPPLIVVPPEARPTGALSEFLSERARLAGRGAAGPARREAAAAGARAAERRARARAATRADRSASDSAASRRSRSCASALNLESLPLRIECFDISNIQDESPVGSMVVFQDAVPKKAHYRKFGIRERGRPGRLRDDGRGRLAPVRAGAPA